MVVHRNPDLSTFELTENTVAVFLTDNKIPLLHEEYGDFGDQGIALLQSADTNNYIKDYIVFDCVNKKIPTIEWLKTNYKGEQGFLKGIYITGSAFDSFSNDHKWIIELRELLAQVVSSIESVDLPPTVGVCFGHQIVSCAAGLKVDRNTKGCEIGMTNLKLTEEGKKIFPTGDGLWISEIHNDIVYADELPCGWQNLASTELCQNQSFYKPGKLLTFQGHPEFHKGVAKKVYLDFMQNGNVTEETYNKAAESCELNPNDGAFMAGAIMKLFKNEI